MNIVEVTKDNFQKEVLDSDKVVLADFWASWCMPCKMMEPVLEKLATDHEERIKIAKVNVDEEGDLATQFGIMSIPTLLIFHGGEKVNQRVGVVSQQVLEEMLKDYLQ
jgi:thioredoxin 1